VKNISVFPKPKTSVWSACPAPLERGVSRSSQTLGAGCGGRESIRRNSCARRLMHLRTAKACGSGIPTLMPSLQKRIAGDGGKKARSPGRARYKPVKPSRREGRIVSVNLWRLTRVLHYSRTRGCGCIAHPAFPAPFLRGRCLWIARAYGVARKRTCVSIVFVAGDERASFVRASWHNTAPVSSK
jgi:hypothetical protein